MIPTSTGTNILKHPVNDSWRSLEETWEPEPEPEGSVTEHDGYEIKPAGHMFIPDVVFNQQTL